jgi:hypothetical protein
MVSAVAAISGFTWTSEEPDGVGAGAVAADESGGGVGRGGRELDWTRADRDRSAVTVGGRHSHECHAGLDVLRPDDRRSPRRTVPGADGHDVVVRRGRRPGARR